jgi:hypothetical protein
MNTLLSILVVALLILASLGWLCFSDKIISFVNRLVTKDDDCSSSWIIQSTKK